MCIRIFFTIVTLTAGLQPVAGSQLVEESQLVEGAPLVAELHTAAARNIAAREVATPQAAAQPSPSRQAAVQQSPALEFEAEEFDFGSILEQAGPVSHTFSFRNRSSEPVVVLSASSTCGCTVPTFSRKPVMPGQQGSIEVSFDPADRPGHFEKQITVTTSDKQAPTVKLRITGRVVPREKSLDELYPVYIGDGLHAETNFHSFSYIEHGKPARTGIGLVNMSSKTLHVDIGSEAAASVYRIEPQRLTLKPAQKGEITVTADLPEGSAVYGTVTESIVFRVNGRRSDATATVTGIAIDNRDLRADNSVPRAELSRTVITFGELSRSAADCTETFSISNRGEAPLEIRAVEGLAEGTELSLRAGDRIEAGESRTVTVTVHPSLKEYGPAVERLRIITDDPARPMRDMKVTMIVENRTNPNRR